MTNLNYQSSEIGLV